MTDFLKLFQHLLPDGRAWRLTIDKRLRQFFAGLTVIPEGVKDSADSVWADIHPDTTTELSEWERQFGLPGNVVGDTDRRLRLAATWRSLIGGQSPRYIQDTLQAAGFNVYVHEWWEPSTPPLPGVDSRLFKGLLCGEAVAQCGEAQAVASFTQYPTPRNPLLWLRREYTNVELLVECGESFAQCGEPIAEAGDSLDPKGYPLVNIITESVPDLLVLCGEAVAECGEAVAECGGYTSLVGHRRNYIVPNDPDKWPFFLYIGGETFGTLAQVDPKRRDEFEALCLKICPTQQWLGMLVEYI